jgi:hypothetical protein
MVQIINARGKTYPASMGDVMADGKPHEQIEILLAAQADITPQKLLSPDGVAATTWDYAPIASTTTVPKDIVVTQIPVDYAFNNSNRDQFDKSTAYAASSQKVPAIPLEIGDKFYLTTAVNCTGLDEGAILIIGTDDIVAIDNTPDALTTTSHWFKLLYAVSATEIVVQYMGIGTFDIAP